MFATGVMDPNWWKYDRLNHRWYRDDDTYADYCEAALIMGFEKSKFIGVHFDGAEGYSAVLIPMTSYMSTDDPFELQISGTMELKSPDGTNKYRVIKIVCESKMLTFTVLKLSSNEEIAVTMVEKELEKLKMGMKEVVMEPLILLWLNFKNHLLLS